MYRTFWFAKVFPLRLTEAPRISIPPLARLCAPCRMTPADDALPSPSFPVTAELSGGPARGIALVALSSEPAVDADLISDERSNLVPNASETENGKSRPVFRRGCYLLLVTLVLLAAGVGLGLGLKSRPSILPPPSPLPLPPPRPSPPPPSPLPPPPPSPPSPQSPTPPLPPSPPTFVCADGNDASQCSALRDFYFATGGQSWGSKSGWVLAAAGTRTDYCSFHGVNCIANDVTGVCVTPQRFFAWY